MNACRPRVAHQLADRQAKRMRQIFERIDVDIVGAAGQEGADIVTRPGRTDKERRIRSELCENRADDGSVQTSRRRAARGKPAQQAERGLRAGQNQPGLASQHAGIVERSRRHPSAAMSAMACTPKS